MKNWKNRKRSSNVLTKEEHVKKLREIDKVFNKVFNKTIKSKDKERGNKIERFNSFEDAYSDVVSEFLKPSSPNILKDLGYDLEKSRKDIEDKYKKNWHNRSAENINDVLDHFDKLEDLKHYNNKNVSKDFEMNFD